MKITLDQSQLQTAFAKKVTHLSQAFDAAIAANIWDWTSAPSPRDIVDTGELLNSRQTLISQGSATIQWTAEHGKYVQQGTNKMSGRDWVEYTLNKEGYGN